MRGANHVVCGRRTINGLDSKTPPGNTSPAGSASLNGKSERRGNAVPQVVVPRALGTLMNNRPNPRELLHKQCQTSHIGTEVLRPACWEGGFPKETQMKKLQLIALTALLSLAPAASFAQQAGGTGGTGSGSSAGSGAGSGSSMGGSSGSGMSGTSGNSMGGTSGSGMSGGTSGSGMSGGTGESGSGSGR